MYDVVTNRFALRASRFALRARSKQQQQPLFVNQNLNNIRNRNDSFSIFNSFNYLKNSCFSISFFNIYCQIDEILVLVSHSFYFSNYIVE